MGSKQVQNSNHPPGELTAFVTCDLGAIVRGRFVAREDQAARQSGGVGWVPANQSLTPFDELAPGASFGSGGDLRLVPDQRSRAVVEYPDAPALDLMLCDLYELEEGIRWSGCPRSLLATLERRVVEETGLTFKASFEHEFQILREDRAEATVAFGLGAFREDARLHSELWRALVEAGTRPETILPEFGHSQLETSCAPAAPTAAADRSVVVKEVIRDVARRDGNAATFSPITGLGSATNGTHIHISACDKSGAPAFSDPAEPTALSATAEAFAAGIVANARALIAFTAPSAISHLRREPGRRARRRGSRSPTAKPRSGSAARADPTRGRACTSSSARPTRRPIPTSPLHACSWPASKG